MRTSLDELAHSDNDLDIAAVAVWRREGSLHVDGRLAAQTRSARGGCSSGHVGGQVAGKCGAELIEFFCSPLTQSDEHRTFLPWFR